MISIPLTRGLFAVVDDVDARLAAFRWHALRRSDGRTFYAVRNAQKGSKPASIYLHRAVLGAAPDAEVDHRNGDGLDCRRANLRFATHSQNAQNVRKPGRIKGVRLARGRWRAYIKIAGKQISLGAHPTRDAAARAYDAAARRLFGEFAVTNFPEAA